MTAFVKLLALALSFLALTALAAYWALSKPYPAPVTGDPVYSPATRRNP